MSGSATLEFKVSYDSSSPHDIEEGTYGVYVPDLGESYGTAVPITGTIGQEWPHFYYAEDYVDPQRTAASQQWYGKYTSHASELFRHAQHSNEPPKLATKQFKATPIWHSTGACITRTEVSHGAARRPRSSESSIYHAAWSSAMLTYELLPLRDGGSWKIQSTR